MKTRKKISARLLAIMLIAALLLPLAWNVPVEAAEAKQIDVLFSHDTHSHLNSFSTIVDGEQKEVGGFATMKRSRKIRTPWCWMAAIFPWEP